MTSIHGKLLSSPRRGEVILQRVDRQRYQHEEIARGKLIDGRLSFEFEPTEPALYRLRFSKGRRLELALDPGQRLTFEHDFDTHSFSGTGSLDTEEFQLGVAFDRRYQLTEYTKRLAAARSRGNAREIAAAENELKRAKQEWFAAFIDLMAALESPLAVYGLFTLYDWNYELGDFDLSGIEAIHRRFEDRAPDSPATRAIGDLIRRYRQTAIGSVLPDYPFPDINGKIVKISDLRGRYVLVDIWASWCIPCRKESPNLVTNYRKYKESGFTIYSISFDDDRDRWLKAIKKDGLEWPYHVSDLKGSHSEATYVYATAPPSYFLLDPEGKILAKRLRGEALGHRLREIFGY